MGLQGSVRFSRAIGLKGRGPRQLLIFGLEAYESAQINQKSWQRNIRGGCRTGCRALFSSANRGGNHGQEIENVECKLSWLGGTEYRSATI